MESQFAIMRELTPEFFVPQCKNVDVKRNYEQSNVWLTGRVLRHDEARDEMLSKTRSTRSAFSHRLGAFNAVDVSLMLTFLWPLMPLAFLCYLQWYFAWQHY